MHIPDHRSFSPEASPRPQRPTDMRSRLSTHQGWKNRVGAALLTAAGMLGAEGCATTNTSPRDEAYSNIQYGAAATRPRSEQTRITERERHQTSYEDCEHQAEYLMRDISSHRYNSRPATLQELSQAIRGIEESAFRQDLARDNQTLLTLRDVDGATATILRQALRFVREERRATLREVHREYMEPSGDAVSYVDAERIAMHIRSLGSLGALANSRAREYFNGGYATPIEDLRQLFNRQLTDQEIVNIDLYASADFVRAYAHALQTQEDQAMARAYAERQRSQRRPIDTRDLPSGITFDATPRAPLRAAPSPAPLMDDPYGDTNQPTHHRHRRHHRGH